MAPLTRGRNLLLACLCCEALGTYALGGLPRLTHTQPRSYALASGARRLASPSRTRARARACAAPQPATAAQSSGSSARGAADDAEADEPWSDPVPETPRAALPSVLRALDAALTDQRAGLSVELALPALEPMESTFKPELMAAFALDVADALAQRAAQRAGARLGATAGPVRIVCSPPAVLEALEAALARRAAGEPDAGERPDGVPPPAAPGAVVCSVVGDEAVPLGGVLPSDGAVIFVCPCALDAEEWSPLWPIREALRAARQGRLLSDGKRVARPIVLLNARLYAQPAELRGFEAAYVFRAIAELPAAARAQPEQQLPGAGGLAALGPAPATSSMGALLPGAGWDAPSQSVALPELALLRTYPTGWRLLARERGPAQPARALEAARGSKAAPGDEQRADEAVRVPLAEWRQVEVREGRPDVKALALVQVQLAYARTRKAQLLVEASERAALEQAAAERLSPASDEQATGGIDADRGGPHPAGPVGSAPGGSDDAVNEPPGNNPSS